MKAFSRLKNIVTTYSAQYPGIIDSGICTKIFLDIVSPLVNENIRLSRMNEALTQVINGEVSSF